MGRGPKAAAATLVLAGLLVAAGCGGAAKPAAPSKTPAAAPAASSTSTPSTAPNAPGTSGGKPAGAGHAYHGSEAWSALPKLGNFAYQSSMVTGSGGKTQTLSFEARYHSPTNYEIIETPPGSGNKVDLILADNGHRYIVQGKGSALDLGAGAQSPYAAMFTTYEAEATTGWGQMFTGSNGTYAGPCSALGRAGRSYHVSAGTGLATAAVAGLSEKVSGTTCIDAATGAPLVARFSWSMGAGGKTASYQDSMKVTQVGGVPVIGPPPGAKAFPGVPGGNAGGVPGGVPGGAPGAPGGH